MTTTADEHTGRALTLDASERRPLSRFLSRQHAPTDAYGRRRATRGRGFTALSIVLDASTYRHPIRLARSLFALRRSLWLRRDVQRRIRDYNRRDFHPDHHDATQLLEHWRTELFGDHGHLTRKTA